MESKCPNCGYCPSCGRANWPQPWPWPYPYWTTQFPNYYWNSSAAPNAVITYTTNTVD